MKPADMEEGEEKCPDGRKICMLMHQTHGEDQRTIT